MAKPFLTLLLGSKLLCDLPSQGIPAVFRNTPGPNPDVLHAPQQGDDPAATPFCVRTTTVILRRAEAVELLYYSLDWPEVSN
jgi:hypothetical protein